MADGNKPETPEEPILVPVGNAQEITANDEAFAVVVYNAITYLDETQATKALEELESRAMRKSNAQVTLQILVHGKSCAVPTRYLLEMTASTPLSEVLSFVKVRCSLKSKRFQMLWLDPGGTTVELDSQTVFSRFVNTTWCAQPLVVHVRDSERTSNAGPPRPLLLHEASGPLFKRYDVNGDRSLNKYELKRAIITDLELKKHIAASDLLLDRFFDGEFKKLDLDGSAELTAEEFTKYVTSMSAWMRAKLLSFVSPKAVFASLACRALEAAMEPCDLPPPVLLEQPRRLVSVVETGVFGIVIEVPALEVERHPQARLAMRTLSPTAIYHLAEGEGAARGEFIFSPVVAIDYPEFDEHYVKPDLGEATAAPYDFPLTLVMPHCFHPDDGGESCVFLGAPHGSTQWRPQLSIDGESDLGRPNLEISEGTMRVAVPYAGTFCAFSNPRVEDLAAVRMHVFTPPELRRDNTSTLRVVLCLALPDKEAEMALTQTAEWGASVCVGTSHLMYVYEGAVLRFRYLSQKQEVTWHGGGLTIEMTIPISGDAGEEPSADDPDEREILRGAVGLDVLEGEGKRSSRPRIVAKRMGIEESGWELPFAVRLKSEVRPNAPVLRLRERTPSLMTIEWMKPAVIDGDGDGDFADITHYAIEMATTAPAGTYYPWAELWAGAGHAAPDFQSEVAMKEAKKSGNATAIKKLQDAKMARAAELNPTATTASTKKKAKKTKKRGTAKEGNGDGPVAEETVDDGQAGTAEDAAADNGEAAKAKAEDAVAATGADDKAILSYTLAIEPSLFGYLRLRCWAEGESFPSRYSNEVKLPRWAGKDEKDPQTTAVESAMRSYFLSLAQHRTDGSAGVPHRIGNLPSKNRWGGDKMPPPPKGKPSEPLMAPVPYDVPRLPPSSEIRSAGAALASLYRDAGVLGGGGGEYFGLRIDHILHAIAGTPTADGASSPSRTVATLQEPLVGFCEVVYADVLLPLLDAVVVAKPSWQHADQKVRGIVQQITSMRPTYRLCVPHIQEILRVLFEVYQILRQCQAEKHITFHMEHLDYTKQVKQVLKIELTERLITSLWRLSTKLLDMQLHVRDFLNGGGVEQDEVDAADLQAVEEAVEEEDKDYGSDDLDDPDSLTRMRGSTKEGQAGGTTARRRWTRLRTTEQARAKFDFLRRGAGGTRPPPQLRQSVEHAFNAPRGWVRSHHTWGHVDEGHFYSGAAWSPELSAQAAHNVATARVRFAPLSAPPSPRAAAETISPPWCATMAATTTTWKAIVAQEPCRPHSARSHRSPGGATHSSRPRSAQQSRTRSGLGTEPGLRPSSPIAAGAASPLQESVVRRFGATAVADARQLHAAASCPPSRPPSPSPRSPLVYRSPPASTRPKPSPRLANISVASDGLRVQPTGLEEEGKQRTHRAAPTCPPQALPVSPAIERTQSQLKRIHLAQSPRAIKLSARSLAEVRSGVDPPSARAYSNSMKNVRRDRGYEHSTSK